MISRVWPETVRTPHGMIPPRSSGPLADALNDMRHGAPRRTLTDALVRFAATIPEGAEVLEIGAGHYDHAPLLNSARLLRFDADPTFAPDIVGDAHDMPIEHGRFAAVLAISVLEHVANPFRVAEEMFRVTAPGGRVFAWVPFYFAVHGFPGDITRFTDEGLKGCFEAAGFVVDELDSERYAGLFFHLTDQVHFHFPRRSPRRWMRIANRALFLPLRAAFPLDRRFKVRTMYAGTELVAHKPA